MEHEPVYARIRIEGGPDATSVKIYRDGVEQAGILEWQINGGSEAPVTAIFKEIVVFDGQINVMPRHRGALDA